MAKKKVNERYNYELEARDVVVYKKSNIPRKMQFVVLRGPGLSEQQAIEENALMQAFAKKRSVKLKILKGTTVETFVTHLSAANVWASGIVYCFGDLEDEDQVIEKKLKRLLIEKLEVGPNQKITSLIEGLKQVVR